MVKTALHSAAGQGQVDTVRMLGRIHPDWLTEREPGSGDMPLHCAAAAGDVQCVRALLEAGTPTDARAADGCTALTLASLAGDVHCVRVLLAAGADIMAADHRFGRTALHFAASGCGSRHASIVCALLNRAWEAGLLPAAVQARNRDGETPLHVAAERGSTACMAALLTCGSDLSATTAAVPGGICGGRETALHLAARGGHVEAVQLIAALAPALATAHAGDGSTPLDDARRCNHVEAAHCLERPVSTAAALSVLSHAVLHCGLALHLFARLLDSRWPLTAEEWEMVPSPCPRLGALLPRAVEESGEQAVLLVRHLPHIDRQHLRASVLGLTLGRDAQREPLPQLPPEIVRRILALSLA